MRDCFWGSAAVKSLPRTVTALPLLVPPIVALHQSTYGSEF